MMHGRLLSLACLGLCASAAMATQLVDVPGSSNKYPATVETRIGDKPVKLILTGTALRARFVNLYAIASYLQEGKTYATAEELAAADCAKRLHLIMEHDVSGDVMADALKQSIRKNYPRPLFAAEIDSMTAFIQKLDVNKGDHIWLTHVPTVGMHINFVGKADLLIKNARFSQPVWDIYLGKNNLGATIKKDLVSRLPAPGP